MQPNKYKDLLRVIFFFLICLFLILCSFSCTVLFSHSIFLGMKNLHNNFSSSSFTIVIMCVKKIMKIQYYSVFDKFDKSAFKLMKLCNVSYCVY